MDTLPSGERQVMASGPPWPVSSFRFRARLGFSIPFTLSGPRGITPAFGYGAPHSSARGTSTPLSNALLSAHYGPLRHPLRPDLTLAGCRLARATPPAGLPVLRPIPSSIHATANTPAEPAGACVARYPAAGSLPCISGGSASTLPVSRPARRSLALRPAWSLSRSRRVWRRCQVCIRRRHPGLTMNATARTAHATPMTCQPLRCSPSTIRARITVLAGYSDDRVTAMLRGP